MICLYFYDIFNVCIIYLYIVIYFIFVSQMITSFFIYFIITSNGRTSVFSSGGIKEVSTNSFNSTSILPINL